MVSRAPGRDDEQLAPLVQNLKSLQRQGGPAKLLLDEPERPGEAMGGNLLLRNSLDGSKRDQVTEAVEAFAPTRAGIHQPQALPIAQTADVQLPECAGLLGAYIAETTRLASIRTQFCE